MMLVYQASLYKGVEARMAYISSLNEKTYKIESGENAQTREIVLDGTAYQLDWQSIAPLAADAQGRIVQGGLYSLLLGGRSYEVCVRRLEIPDETAGVTYEIVFAGQRFEVHVIDEREQALTGVRKSGSESGEINVRAPMPGLVLNVLKKAGESVERGETVAILEAMKMENDLSTPRGGVVKEVRVSKGQTVSQNDILVVINGDA
jgi:biotin carboxyl carrier protein